MKSFFAAIFLLCTTLPATAQGNQLNAGFPYKDTSMLKPPAGVKVAIYEFDDLQCGGCAAAYPVFHAAADRYKVPIVHRDYPWSFHPWSFDAAVTARYLADKVSPAVSEAFRRDLFANQSRIGGRDDLTAFTRRWFQANNQSLPFVMDATGVCKNEVQADRALGNRLNVRSTPCLFVVTQSRWVPVGDLSQLNHTIEMALAETQSLPRNGTAPAVRRSTSHP